MRQLSCKSQGKDDPGSFRKPNGSVPLTTVPEEYGNVLREMADENIVDNQSSARLSDPSCIRSTSRFTKSGSLSERSELTARSTQPAAGYCPVPKNLNSIADALIAASGDPSSMAAALELELARAALIGSKEEPLQQSKQSDRSQSSPTVSLGSAHGSMHSDRQNVSCILVPLLSLSELVLIRSMHLLDSLIRFIAAPMMTNELSNGIY